MWHLLAADGIKVDGSKAVCEEFILVPSVSVTYIASISVGWMLWHIFLKHRKLMVHPESDMAVYILVIVTEFQCSGC